MRIYLHIGPEEASAAPVQSVLADKREQLTRKGVLYSRSLGNKNHTRLFMAATDPGHVDPLRFNRGYITPQKQSVLRDAVISDLAREIDQHSPDTLIVSCTQLGSGLRTSSELERLHAMLSPLSDDIRVIAHVDLPTRMLARTYSTQILEGRGVSLDAELDLVGSDWWHEALKRGPQIDPAAGVFAETQSPNYWLDLPALVAFWEDTFGAGSVHLHSYDEDQFATPEITDLVCTAFDIDATIGKVDAVVLPAPTPAASLARGRQLNALILQVLASRQRILPRQLWRSFVQDVAVDGPPLDLASLHPITKHFAPALKTLVKEHKGLHADTFKAPRAKGSWSEADPLYGYRPSQYLLGFMWRIDKATREEQQKRADDLTRLASTVAGAPEAPRAQEATPRSEDDAPDGLSETARKLMPPLAIQNFEKLRASSFAPHNKMGSVNEEELAAAYAPIQPRDLPKGNSGNVIVGCMKNEAPYIIEWVAYHRAMGVDNFLIYTNGCEDGTTEILDRLQEMGVLQHRNNDEWKGNSPQQHALNCALKEPVIKNAEWIIHIDVDEFMNVRCGNGTVQDFLAAVPDATNVAMTWRLFGHNGVTQLNDDFVIDQFDKCAPKFCPKPHTVWGFKTMFKNIGAYEKISCHRPNKLDEDFQNKVKWVNGSGKDMTKDVAENGWRSSKKNIGYDLLQLNHYALRSAESFLIKRQRGRALHVDRSIGINYWIRMDWSDFRDITVKRNVPRLRAEYDRLMQDDTLCGWHETGVKWHLAKAEELHQNPEFANLYKEALAVKLTETERVAYALALDMES